MRSSLLAIPLVAVIGLSVAADAAKADCSADIQAAEMRIAALTGKEKQRSGAAKAAQDLVNKAKDARSEGKTKRCEKLAQKARAKLE